MLMHSDVWQPSSQQEVQNLARDNPEIIKSIKINDTIIKLVDNAKQDEVNELADRGEAIFVCLPTSRDPLEPSNAMNAKEIFG